MSESIQNCETEVCQTSDTRRRAFLAHAAELYGRPAADLTQSDDLDELDDAGAILLAFPWLSDPELSEALWALANF